MKLGLKFTKAQALGNDFIIIEDLTGEVELSEDKIRALCDRRFGVGADGILLLLPSKKADFKMRIFNTDGGEASMSGNGVRCLAAYIFERGLNTEEGLVIETMAGERQVHLNLSQGKVQSVRVNMGKPTSLRNELIKVGDLELEAICLSIGNPHCVVFVENVKTAPVGRLGPTIEHLPIFPKRTNVEFVEIASEDELRMRVWERGVGETLACGTGASASVVAAASQKLAKRKATVHLEGGDLSVEWAQDDHVYLTGPASLVYSGEFYDSD